MASAITHFIVGAALALPALESDINTVLPKWAIPVSRPRDGTFRDPLQQFLWSPRLLPFAVFPAIRFSAVGYDRSPAAALARDCADRGGVGWLRHNASFARRHDRWRPRGNAVVSGFYREAVFPLAAHPCFAALHVEILRQRRVHPKIGITFLYFGRRHRCLGILSLWCVA
jgi:hypothetical protein